MNKSRLIQSLMTFTSVWLAGFIFCSGSAAGAEDHFALLKKRLISDNFPTRIIITAYQPQPAACFKTVAQTLRMRESKLDYAQFLRPIPIGQARQFLSSNEAILTQAEKKYGVDRSVIVAILLVETQLGKYTGRAPVLAVLSTFAIMDQKSSRDKIWSMLPANDRKRWERDAFDRKLRDRAQWAYEEICALLRWANAQSVDVQSFRGSVMGAIGWAQFLPSSLLRYGADGNGDGCIDLYQVHDAVFSVANYLREHGWHGGADRTSQEQVIYTYNRSRPYVTTILEIADLLRPNGKVGSLSHAAGVTVHRDPSCSSRTSKEMKRPY